MLGLFRDKSLASAFNLLLIWKWWNAIDCEIACDRVKRANEVLGLCKEIFARKHTATHT